MCPYCCKRQSDIDPNHDSVAIGVNCGGGGHDGTAYRDQEQLFYSFNLEEVVPDDHLVRAIAAFSICRGFGASWHRTILLLAGRRSIRC